MEPHVQCHRQPPAVFHGHVVFFLSPVAAVKPATEGERMEKGSDIFELILTTMVCLLLSTFFLLGRWSGGRAQAVTVEAGV